MAAAVAGGVQGGVATRRGWSRCNGSGPRRTCAQARDLRVDPFDGENCFVWIVDPATGFIRGSLQGLEWINAPDGHGIVFGHVPGSESRRTPDQGRLIQWRPSLKIDDQEAGTLPSADAAVRLQTLAVFPWQERPLPWAGTRSPAWEIGGGVFAALLVLLLALRRWRPLLVLLLVVLLISAGFRTG